MTTSGNVTVADNFVLCDASGGAVTATLPDATTVEGFEVTVKKIDGSPNTCTVVDGNGSPANIDGAASLVISTRYDSYTMQSNGTQWWVK